ncbi:hypothetical protein [Olivibacter domesticus]|uniref:Uncharacterized protein n=1 Tax=Olivibacter domesticus TaxID=407022 RepID=A0A1H7WQT0_OLID1|nr:hypothetical protein [Olivibacter domesticus]SEM23317.1 hypothetical protein SAMN05661044_04597 [Olivibacter domesticus]
MAYLTQYSYSKLCQKVDIDFDTSLNSFIWHIYDDNELYYILNKRDIEYLFKYKLILEDEKKFAVEYFVIVPKEEDSKEWVFNKGGKTKYHMSLDCQLLRKDYVDFYIPREIRSLGDSAIDEYRIWFSKNRFAEKFKAKSIGNDAIISAFNSKYPKKYCIQPIAEGSNILVIEKPNSKNIEVKKHFDLRYFKNRIDFLKQKFHNEFTCKNTRTMSKFRFLDKKTDEEIRNVFSEIFSPLFVENYGLEKIRSKFKQAIEVINEIISLVLEYLRWKWNFLDKQFDEISLESFGLECCHACSF